MYIGPLVNNIWFSVTYLQHNDKPMFSTLKSSYRVILSLRKFFDSYVMKSWSLWYLQRLSKRTSSESMPKLFDPLTFFPLKGRILDRCKDLNLDGKVKIIQIVNF